MRLASQGRRHHRARIAPGPSADINRMKEFVKMPIERTWFFKIYCVSGIRHYDQTGSWDRAFHQEAGLKTRPILIAGHNQRWHCNGPHPVHEVK
jgi:hypothetical protein